jgi:Ice-binding-like
MNLIALAAPYFATLYKLGCPAAMLLAVSQGQAATLVNLGTASGFGILANTAITVAGPSTISGDAGTLSGTGISGPGPLTLSGINHGGDAFTQTAHADFAAAFTNAAGQAADFNYAGAYDLGGLNLLPGVHRAPVSLAINGTLTLNAMGNPDAVWIFQTASTLVTGSSSTVILMGGAQADHVFWQVGSSATLGTGSHLEGHLLAQTSITLTTGASANGGLYARDGAITLDTNVAGIPEPSGMMLMAAAVGLVFLQRRPSRRAV